MNKNTIIMIILGALILIAILQAFQLFNLRPQLGRTDLGGTCMPSILLFLTPFWNKFPEQYRQKHKY